MFDSFKAAGALAGLMKNKEALKAAGERIKQRLGELRAAGAAGGGAVRVTVSGDMKVTDVHLEPALVSSLADPASRAMAQAMIADATNAALEQAKSLAQREVAKEADALGLPDMPGLKSMFGA